MSGFTRKSCLWIVTTILELRIRTLNRSAEHRSARTFRHQLAEQCSALRIVGSWKELRLFLSLLFWFLTALCIPPLAGAATLSGSFIPLPAGTNINLTTEGKLDWVHWGLGSGWTVERKYGVAQQIAYSFSAPSDKYYDFYDGPFQLTDAPLTFTWSDGTPEQLVTSTASAVYIYGDKQSGNIPNGFQIQCPADTTMKRLRVYVGTSGANGTFSASLSGATTYTDGSLSGSPSNGVYTINFQADSIGQVLTVNFTSTDTSGYLYLQAATLTGPNMPPSATIATPTDGAVLKAPATLSVSATASDSDGTVTNLSLLNGATLFGRTNSGWLNLTISNLSGGPYRLFAVATDNGGLSITSRPANIFVTTGGGTLSVNAAASPADNNLATEGTIDWTHWGLTSPTSLDRKAAVASTIPNARFLNATSNDLQQFTVNVTGYTWTDGTPTAAASDSTTGIFIYSTNHPPGAFQLTVPATNTLRRLKVYVGLYGAQGRMDAWLSDHSAVAYSDTSFASEYGDTNVVYTFFYSSTHTGAVLHVRWSPAIALDPFYGNVTLQSATLSPPPPAPLLMAPAFLQPGEFNFSFLTQTGVIYTVCWSSSLNPADWQVLTNFSGTRTNMSVSDFSTNAGTRFYRVQVQ